MKRSTLTLSILTALLVSACGGSSSNDEQTKDPTPPKVTPTTPTNPSTPSTGKTTPTTGNKDNAGSSAGSSSSSSSDPTPPISSGSAPSGGKPIVVNPPKTDEHTDDGDEDEEKKKKDEDKPVTADDIKALQDALDKTTAEVNELTGKEQSLAKQKQGNIDSLKEKITTLKNKLSLSSNNDARLETIKTKLDQTEDQSSASYKANKKLYDEAVGAEKTWLDTKAKQRKTQRDIETAKEKQIKEAQDLALAKAKQALAAAEILSEKEYAQAMENLANLKADYEKQKLDEDKIETQVKDKGEIAQDLGALKLQQNDLAAALGLDGISPKQQKDLTEKKKKVDDDIKALEDKKTELENQKLVLTPKVQIANKKATAAGNAVTAAKTIAQNRGVSGVKGYSEKSLVDIIKAEQNQGKTSWIITFADAPDDPVTIDMSANNSPLSTEIKDTDGSTVLGKSGKIADKNIAYAKPSTTSTNSIYGYINDKFYSVGVTSDKDKVEKITSVDNVTYNGKALLKDKDGKDMIATFVGNADFGGKTFGGGFSGFASYKPGENATAITTNPALKDPIGFAAKIEGNKFMTTTPNEKKANVYGFFYGEDTSDGGKPAEVGGLVEFKEFHGSFGGAK